LQTAISAEKASPHPPKWKIKTGKLAFLRSFNPTSAAEKVRPSPSTGTRVALVESVLVIFADEIEMAETEWMS